MKLLHKALDVTAPGADAMDKEGLVRLWGLTKPSTQMSTQMISLECDMTAVNRSY